MVAAHAGTEYTVAGVVDDNVALHGKSLAGVPVLGGIEIAVEHPEAEVVVCIGSGEGRERLVRRLAEVGVCEDRFGTIVDPTAVVPQNCLLGVGTVLLARVVLTADVTLGRHVVAMPGVVMTHDDVIDDYATLCAGVVLGGGVHVGRRAYLGMNSSIRQNLHLGRDSTVGMGSVLLRDLPAAATWAGIPARPLGVSGRQPVPNMKDIA